ncbi:MAG: hypothetical protein QM765_35245 [Myxococcales bacterium]
MRERNGKISSSASFLTEAAVPGAFTVIISTGCSEGSKAKEMGRLTSSGSRSTA